jgi:hypothetical protein
MDLIAKADADGNRLRVRYAICGTSATLFIALAGLRSLAGVHGAPDSVLAGIYGRARQIFVPCGFVVSAAPSKARRAGVACEAAPARC